jgi:hypothetical protein
MTEGDIHGSLHFDKSKQTKRFVHRIAIESPGSLKEIRSRDGQEPCHAQPMSYDFFPELEQRPYRHISFQLLIRLDL